MSCSRALGLTLVLAMVAFAQSPDEKRRVPEVDKLRIGVVDLAKVFDGYDKRKVKEEEFKAKEDNMNLEYEDRKERVKRLRAELDLLREGTSAYELKEEEVTIAMSTLKYFEKRRRETLKALFEGFILELLQEIEVVVRDIGKADGYHLIIKVDRRGSTEEGSTPLDFRSILYFSEEIDISDQILRILNAKYRERPSND